MEPILPESTSLLSPWGIKVDWRPRPTAGTCVSVTDGILPDPVQRNLVPLRVQTSAQWSPLLSSRDYEPKFLAAHARRLGSGGQRKGRVLYLRGNHSPLAALCWSLPPSGQPLYAVAAATAAALEAQSPADAVTAIELLLSCLGAITEAVGEEWSQNHLGWAVPRTTKENEDRVAQTVHELFGFRGVKRDAFPSHISRRHAAHYLVRERN